MNLQQLLEKPLPEAWHSKIRELKEAKGGLLALEEYEAIARLLLETSPCNLLVFGLGHDSALWSKINKDGKTRFVEDDSEWIKSFPHLDIEQVNYRTKVEEWESIGFEPNRLELNLSADTLSHDWDVVIVDGPLGHNPPRPYKGPGRMSSIYMGYRLAKVGGMVIVDDMKRVVERTYASHFLGDENLIHIMNDKLAFYKKSSAS